MKIKELVASNRLKEAFDILLEETKGTYFENQVITLNGSFSSTESQQIIGILDNKDENLAFSQTRHRLLKTIDKWEEEKTYKERLLGQNRRMIKKKVSSA